jgi:carbonic anhydrase
MNKILILLSSLTLVATILVMSPSYNLKGISTLKISAYAIPQQQQYQLNNTTTTTTNLRPNLKTDFNPTVVFPQISNSSYIDPFAVIIGDCRIGKLVLVAPTAVCRGDEGTPIHVGDYSSLQDGASLHGLETTVNGTNIDDRRYSTEGTLLKANNTSFKDGFSVFIGDKVSVAHGVLVHGPAYVGNDTFIGMKSLIFNAKVGKRVAVGVSSTVTNGVSIPDDKFVPPGSIITTQQQADKLPSRIGSPYEKINSFVVHVNKELAKGSTAQNIQQLATEVEDQIEEGEMLQTASPTGSTNATNTDNNSSNSMTPAEVK